MAEGRNQKSGGALGRALNPGLLSGITFPHWCSLLWENRFRINLRYLPRALSITLSSVVNSATGTWEEWRHGKKWRTVEPWAPVFVIGLARSGTSHLHNLLCTHPGLAYPSMIECRYPLSFLTLGGTVGALMKSLLGGRRAQDNVAIGPGTPAEDESALIALGARSSLLASSFARSGEHYERYRYSDGFDKEEARAWIEALRTFCGKLAWWHQKPLVFKNPAHTAKIPFLLAAFPEAKIVFIHRHPHDVVRSRQHAASTVAPLRRLQHGRPLTVDRHIGLVGDSIRHYLRDRELVPRGNLVEVAYEDLSSDPVGTVERIYRGLELPGFEQGKPALEAYLAGLGCYRKNRHEELPESVRDSLLKKCPEWFNEWGYSQ